jgi:valyl-tRNA synthetase
MGRRATLTATCGTDDYECGKRQNLEFITMLSPEGAINENGAPFTGMMRYDARMAVEAALKEKVRGCGKQVHISYLRCFNRVSTKEKNRTRCGLVFVRVPGTCLSL